MTDGTAEAVDAEAVGAGAAASERGRERRLMALLCAGHFWSHFYMLTLPPLFLLLKDHFAVSYAALGLIMTVYHVSTGAIQAPMGFLVDRFGARHILILGLALNGLAIALMGVVDNYMLILVFAVFAGLGNSVFHPADYAIMADRIHASRLGRAIGIHMFAGNLGWVAAPLTMTTLAALWNWRIALIVVGIAGIAVALIMAVQGALLGGAINAGKGAKSKDTPKGHSGVGLLMSPPMLAFLAFFVMMASVTSGLQSFSTTALVNLHGISLTAANAALTTFICANAAGVLFGGFVSDGLKRPDLAVGLLLALGAVGVFLPGLFDMPYPLLLACFLAIGLVSGAIRPSRDMMLRQITPKSEVGKVFAFMSVGLSVGAAAAPLAFGRMLDGGVPFWVFAASAGAMVASIFLGFLAQFWARRLGLGAA